LDWTGTLKIHELLWGDSMSGIDFRGQHNAWWTGSIFEHFLKPEAQNKS
jgi:hypothetical protein